MTTSVTGVILAGGLSRRMGGGDKALKSLGGKTIVERVIERAKPQCDRLVLNANGDAARFAEFGLPVSPDVVPDFAGPLAGVLTGLEWAAQDQEAGANDEGWLASFACDAPFFPEDLVARLLEAIQREGADMACAASHGRSHPVFALWPLRLREDLRRAMIEEEIRKVDAWTGRYKLVTVDFPDIELPGGKVDPFFNANRPDDLTEAERLIA